jgi:hypothetical protein
MMAEQIIMDWAAASPDETGVLLRYFNPVGAHPSTRLGEGPTSPRDTPRAQYAQNLSAFFPDQLNRQNRRLKCGHECQGDDRTV